MNRADITDLNRAFFHALQIAAARDLPEACARFGVSADFAAAVRDMPQAVIERLSGSGLVHFRPVLDLRQLQHLAGIEDPQARGIVARLSVNPESDEPTLLQMAKTTAKKMRGRSQKAVP